MPTAVLPGLWVKCGGFLFVLFCFFLGGKKELFLLGMFIPEKLFFEDFFKMSIIGGG